MHFLATLALLLLAFPAVIPSSSLLSSASPLPTQPCGSVSGILPPPNGGYTFQDVQIALRTPSNGNPTFAPETQYCLHPGGPVQDPSAPSVGLYGGLKVGLVDCKYATYRWSIRKDGDGIVVGNGQDPIWALNAEEVGVGSEVTIREADQESPNQEFRLVTDGINQIRLGYTEGPLLCLAGDPGDKSVKVDVCGTSDVQEQSWVILLLPRPVPGSGTASANSGVASTQLPSPTSSWVQPSSVTWSMPVVCPTTSSEASA